MVVMAQAWHGWAGMADKAQQIEWVAHVLGVDFAQLEPDDAADLDVAEPSPALLANGDTYRAYLTKWLRQMRVIGKVPFGVALGRAPDAHRMALHRSREPKTLSVWLVGQTGLHAITWGQAEPDPERPMTLRLHLEGRQLPGLRKKCNEMLHEFRPLPYQKVSLAVAGAEVDDLPDEADQGITPPRGLADLPEVPGPLSVQGEALVGAARKGIPFCEECPSPPA
jgi:hypothetical protein